MGKGKQKRGCGARVGITREEEVIIFRGGFVSCHCFKAFFVLFL